MDVPGKGSAKDRLIDLFVFAPVGMALTVAEELPNLVEKGRNRIEGRSATARVVGQFAVQIGSREVTRRIRRMFEPEAPKSGPGPAPAARSQESDRPEENRRVEPPSETSRLDGPASSGSANGQVAAGDLAIPAYDSLSASQVVKLLAGLSKEELVEVQIHERSNRHRATILNRIEQLLSGDPSLEGL
jgi:hypothetical protein